MTDRREYSPPALRGAGRTFHIAGRDIVIGRSAGFWSDLHHRALTVSWPVFFLGAAAVFLVFNTFFAALYSLGTDPIANIPKDSPHSLLYFSIETLATVGYGDMHPQTDWGHIVATIEIFTGMSMMAVMTGLVFTRFSRPQARFLFANNPVVAPFDGMPTLMVRIANARGNIIADATAKLWLVRDEKSLEGLSIRRFHQLELRRQENPLFALSWTLYHTIGPESPLVGCDADTLAAGEAALILTVDGLDESTTQHLMARNTWTHGDIRWNHRYVDVLSRGADGRMRLDYARFHEVVEVAPSAVAVTAG